MPERISEASNLRARSTAALVLWAHARIVPADPLRRAPGAAPPSVSEEVPRGLVASILQWTALLAAIAAPWVLLLTP